MGYVLLDFVVMITGGVEDILAIETALTMTREKTAKMTMMIKCGLLETTLEH